MTDRLSEKRPRVDRPANARIVRSALDEVKAIQTLLMDVYKDAGDGRTVLRELVQNADDAEASQLTFLVVDVGWPEAENSLLRGPALIVANDGPFHVRDRDALYKAVGGSKTTDAGKVGRFGVGLKSVFHLCEAMVYLGFDDGTQLPGVLNPWAGTGESGNYDPLHPDWDDITDGDLDRLLSLSETLFGGGTKGLLQWIPLRRAEHIDRGEGQTYGLGKECPTPDDIRAWFARSGSFAMLLAQCGHLRSIEAGHISRPHVSAPTPLMRVRRFSSSGDTWVGRPTDDAQIVLPREFRGTIDDGSLSWAVLGQEACGSEVVRNLRSGSDWPSDLEWHDGRSTSVPRKALAHAAITILRPLNPTAHEHGAQLRWAVFLPLDDAPTPRSGGPTECVGRASESVAWQIILHGYFWPSHDRRSIPGVTDDEAGSGESESALRSRWNRAVRDELLLPLLPRVLANAAAEVSQSFARQQLAAIVSSLTLQQNETAVAASEWLLPIIAEKGVTWQVRPARGTAVLSVPEWRSAPESVQRLLTQKVARWPDTDVIIDRDAPRIGPEPSAWPEQSIADFLDCIDDAVFNDAVSLHWFAGTVRHIIGAGRQTDEGRAAQLARWLVQQVAGGALDHAVRGNRRDQNDELRSAWQAVFDSFPTAWTLSAQLDCYRAVVELAVEAALGPGLLVVPLGRQAGTSSADAEPECVDQALRVLGRRLASSSGTPKVVQRARLLLAEVLLGHRGDRPLDQELAALPLLRARRLPNDTDDPWTLEDLEANTLSRRVFSRQSSDDADEGPRLDAPKATAIDLASAVGTPVWLVDQAVGALSGAPIPSPAALAAALMASTPLQSPPAERQALLTHLGSALQVPDVATALRTLLTGGMHDAEETNELFYVRGRDTESAANHATLHALLGLIGCRDRTADTALTESLPQSVIGQLNVTAVDSGVLQRLLDVALRASVNWSGLPPASVVQLLQRLHGSSREERARWRSMPLHRSADGRRVPIDESTRRASKSVHVPDSLADTIRLLEPDDDVSDLYGDIDVVESKDILRAMLVRPNPEKFSSAIIRSLRDDTAPGQTNLPRDPELRQLLRDSPWLPDLSRGAGIAPSMLLVLPTDELRRAVEPLARAACLGLYRLTSEVDVSTWRDDSGPIRDVVGGRQTRAAQIELLASAIDSTRLPDVSSGAYLVALGTDVLEVEQVTQILETPLAGVHPGWGLVRAAADALDRGVGASALLTLAQALAGPVPAHRQVEMLACLARSRPARDSAAGLVFRRLVEEFATNAAFFSEVLPSLELPTQDGRWSPAHTVASSASGLDRRHLVIGELRRGLKLHESRSSAASSKSSAAAPVVTLESYFEAWRGKVPEGAVGALLSLLGSNEGLDDLAAKWLGEDTDAESVRYELCGRQLYDLRVLPRARLSGDEDVVALNVVGDETSMKLGGALDSVFAVDPAHRNQNIAGADRWELTLRDISSGSHSTQTLIDLLGGAVEWWAVHVLNVERRVVSAWWSKWGTGSQVHVAPVRASILASLPLTLAQLDVRECDPLQSALRQAQHGQRKREQAAPAHMREAMELERASLDRLRNLIVEDEANQRFLWGRVQRSIRNYGYGPESVLLELAQNADDALAQAEEMSRKGLPASVRTLTVRVHEEGGELTLDFIHLGRPINDSGGAAFPAGADRQWDQDLYFMMLLNLSGKPGETPGGASAASTTGRFGLGFKSVHLVSPKPTVVSGFVAFSIAGGLLPVDEPVPDDPTLLPQEGFRPTRIRLPLRNDFERRELLAQLFSRFTYARVLLPVFARQLREVVVEGGPSPGIHCFDPCDIVNAPGWSVASESMEIPGHGHWKLVRFRPADAQNGSGTAAIAVGLRDGLFKPLPADLPFLWNVTPTSEGWGCGYAVNGPFKLDPGRTHVSLEDAATVNVVDALGRSLGEGLVTLHDALSDGRFESGPLESHGDSQEVLASLWVVLAAGLNTTDEARTRFLLSLHGQERGLARWMASRSVVPSGLPSPFLQTLPPISSDSQVRAADGRLADPLLCGALSEVAGMVDLIKRHRVVSSDVARRLRPFLIGPIVPMKPSELFAELAEDWDYTLTPVRLHSLKPLARDDVWTGIGDATEHDSWRAGLEAVAASGDAVPLRHLLLPPDIAWACTDDDLQEELSRSAFAPPDALLDGSYIGDVDDVRVFLRLRKRHEIGADTLSIWFADTPPAQQSAALRYLLFGRLLREVLERLVPVEARPSWLSSTDAVQQALEDLDVEPWRCQSLLSALFPSDPVPDSTDDTVPDSVQRLFFERLQEWWDREDNRRAVIDSYETQVWPDWLLRTGLAKELRADSRDHWLALLILGACQSLGRTHEAQHRSFLQLAYQEGWWAIFRDPDQPGPWMEVLRTWQDRAVHDLTWQPWMGLFPSIYQLSRYLDVYRRLLRGAGRRPSDLYLVTRLLAPRGDEALTGAGVQFDAPPAPLKMGLHWVLRELVRLEVVEGDHLWPDCWVPAEQVLSLLQPLGLAPLGVGTLNSQKAHALHGFMAERLNGSSDNLHRAFDVPLRYVAADLALRQQFGLEE